MPERSDLIYTYDSTFEGLLCCVFESVYSKEIPFDIVCEDDLAPTLFDVRKIVTNSEKAARVYNSIPLKMGDFALDLVTATFFSGEQNKAMIILNFLLFGYKQGMNAVRLMSNPNVTPIFAAHKAVKGEVHKLKGFIRFSDFDGALVAQISPKHYVLPYLKNHFCTRYKDDDFLLFDDTHSVALVKQKGVAKIIALDKLDVPCVNEDEEKYRAMWLKYYNTVAIKERLNPKCQMTHMPKRFWKHMTEMQNSAISQNAAVLAESI